MDAAIRGGHKQNPVERLRRGEELDLRRRPWQRLHREGDDDWIADQLEQIAGVDSWQNPDKVTLL